MVGEKKLDSKKIGKEIERAAKSVVEQEAVWIEVRKDDSEALKRELEYFGESVLAEVHRRVFEKVLPKFVDLEKIYPVDEYEENFYNDKKDIEETWLTEKHEFDVNVQFDREFYSNYVIIGKNVIGRIWYLELFILRKVATKDKIKYLVLRDDLKYLKEYTFKDLEILENVKAIIQ